MSFEEQIVPKDRYPSMEATVFIIFEIFYQQLRFENWGISHGAKLFDRF